MCNIPRSKDNQAMRFGQSIENIYGSIEVLYSLFIQVEGYQNKLKLSCWPLTFTSFKAFLKNKRSGTTLAGSFPAWLSKKNV